MNIKKAKRIIKQVSKDCSIYEAVEDARTLNIQVVLDAYEAIKKNYTHYQIVNKLF